MTVQPGPASALMDLRKEAIGLFRTGVAAAEPGAAVAALATSGDLLMTGAAGTNVADLQIVLMR
ncbi:hypothetical protein AU467_34705 [Mesorhizobium loti]|uniref:MOFRL domain-containing protein n=1 Tax=Rhizobium loti TaxID=381 RepID=A0A101KWT6_RHILI|nr:hypothetical protein AU467_34705 [Mesorhizobium loti]